MTVGDLVTADFHLELRGLLHGPGTRFSWGASGWQGLGLPAVKTTDVDLDGADGSYPGRDLLTSRILTFPVEWGGTTKADVMTDLDDLVEAWDVSTSTSIELHAQLPGWGHWFVTGRPRGLVEDLSRLASGEGSALLTFLAHDPTITRVP